MRDFFKNLSRHFSRANIQIFITLTGIGGYNRTIKFPGDIYCGLAFAGTCRAGYDDSSQSIGQQVLTRISIEGKFCNRSFCMKRSSHKICIKEVSKLLVHSQEVFCFPSLRWINPAIAFAIFFAAGGCSRNQSSGSISSNSMMDHCPLWSRTISTRAYSG